MSWPYFVLIVFYYVLFLSSALAQPLAPEADNLGFGINGSLKVVITPGNAEPYTMVRVQASSPDDFKSYDLMILTTHKGVAYFVDAIETKNKGEFVFTGPPGSYTIRMTGYHDEKGFVTTTGNMVIGKPVDGGPAPVDPSEPPPPPTPVDPNNPSTGPPPEGYFGFGPLVYNLLIKDRPKPEGVKQLAANFEWAAAVGGGIEIKALIAELKKRNEAVYTANKDLESFRKVWTEHANRLIDNGIIEPSIKDHQQAYKETAAGIRAAYGR